MLLLMPKLLEASRLPVERIATVRFPIDNSGRMCWPSVEDVCDAAQGAERIAVTGNKEPDVIAQMLRLADDCTDNGRPRIVCEDEPVPASLIAEFPVSLHCLLRRLLPCDLIVVPMTEVISLHSSGTIAEAVLSSSPESDALARTPSLERFPAAGPGSPVISPGVIRSGLATALVPGMLSDNDRRCLEAGMLLLWDQLDESHEISQSLEGHGSPRTADYWHGILHRREPDAGNASYWFQRVGRHPAFDSLAAGLEAWMTELGAPEQLRHCARQRLLSDDGFDPFAMIELSQTAMESPGSPEEQALRMVQYLEILNLLGWSVGNH